MGLTLSFRFIQFTGCDYLLVPSQKDLFHISSPSQDTHTHTQKKRLKLDYIQTGRERIRKEEKIEKSNRQFHFRLLHRLQLDREKMEGPLNIQIFIFLASWNMNRVILIDSIGKHQNRDWCGAPHLLTFCRMQRGRRRRQISIYERARRKVITASDKCCAALVTSLASPLKNVSRFSA